MIKIEFQINAAKNLFYITLLILLILLLAVSYYGYKYGFSPTPEQTAGWPKTDDERRFWARRIEKAGPDKAYEEFKTKYQSSDVTTQHKFAGIFGEALYEKLGSAGIAACDESFISGCFYGFISRAMEKEGLKIIPRLNEACSSKRNSRLRCNFGAGQGILSFLGHEKINDALAACQDFSWKGAVGGCASGVLTEYNFAKNKKLDNPNQAVVSIRPLDPAQVYAPCPGLPDKFLSVCSYEEPIWWMIVLNYDFKKIAGLCESAGDKLNQNFCFIGLGRAAAHFKKYDINETIAVCEGMPDGKKSILCRAGGFLNIFDHTDDRQFSIKICDEGLETADRLACRREANLFGTAF